MKVSVIYVAYRTPVKMLRESMASVEEAAQRAGLEIEILIADNGGAAAHAEELAPATVLGNGENGGFGHGVNLAIASATGDWVLLMNPDSTASSDLLIELERARLANEEPALFGALLLNGDQPQVHAYNVWWSSVHLQLKKRKWNDELQAIIRSGEPHPVVRLCGAGLYASRDHLRSLGPFDEDFFLYGEDVDLSLRAKDAGARTLLVPTAVVHHDAGTSSDGVSDLVERARTDAHLRVIARHRGYWASLVGRADAVAAALVGAALTRDHVRRSTRLARLREIRRWGLHRSAPRFDPQTQGKLP